MPKPRSDRPRKGPKTEEKKTMPDQVCLLKMPTVKVAVNIHAIWPSFLSFRVWSQVWLLK